MTFVPHMLGDAPHPSGYYIGPFRKSADTALQLSMVGACLLLDCGIKLGLCKITSIPVPVPQISPLAAVLRLKRERDTMNQSQNLKSRSPQ
nr:hypothetical protein CFP56_21359 [Quercus suber]